MIYHVLLIKEMKNQHKKRGKEQCTHNIMAIAWKRDTIQGQSDFK